VNGRENGINKHPDALVVFCNLKRHRLIPVRDINILFDVFNPLFLLLLVPSTPGALKASVLVAGVFFIALSSLLIKVKQKEKGFKGSRFQNFPHWRKTYV
jgi:hypothetical protein